MLCKKLGLQKDREGALPTEDASNISVTPSNKNSTTRSSAKKRRRPSQFSSGKVTRLNNNIVWKRDPPRKKRRNRRQRSSPSEGEHNTSISNQEGVSSETNPQLVPEGENSQAHPHNDGGPSNGAEGDIIPVNH